MLRLEMSYSGVVHQKCRSSTTRLDLLTSVSQLVLLFLLAAAWSRDLKYGAPLHLQCLQPSRPESNYDNEANND